MTAEEFAAAALAWLGVPYHHQGRSRLGCDCIGLPLGVLAEAGALPAHVKPRANYGRRPMQALVDELERYCTVADAPAAGVLVTIHWPNNALPGHVAIVTPPPAGCSDGLYIVHAHMRARRVVVNAFTGAWRQRATGYWLVPGVSYG